ncbi:uncharacterized protein A1O9_08939 [Exophiala aquamarina CBS 119918]|uniref:Ribosomal RNA-processing protein 42 n=1 Tax=Exophiala aquamarina CBS 119918 TaxID=1182545 RepID=A0A072PIH3_9EURO|nr:uncharacterized protein A1O9_08939 [Exophiala aquamarina CBS 119918]KEF55285.1 hypothetical protein A1O9_08939 [Exophiala aquamarina CBS 119918]
MPSFTTALPFSPAELAYLHTSLSSIPPLRPDARQLSTDFRPLRAETGILPSVNGSAHVGFSDGREAIVGVKLEVEKTAGTSRGPEPDGDAMDVDAEESTSIPAHRRAKGPSEWVTLTLTLPGLRDDDTNLIYLEEMLREPLVVASTSPDRTDQPSPTLLDKLIINTRWHWRIYIDVLLISPNGLASYPLPLLSMATHLALRDTRIPKLKSEGEEDPIADDDWMASTYLYQRDVASAARPPVTLLVVAVGESVLFDPSREELAVADSVVAVSVGSDSGEETDILKLLAIRMIDTPARDTMKGVPQSGEPPEGVDVPGVWKPRLGGIKRSTLKAVVQAVFAGGVARDVLTGLDGFLSVETGASVG